MEQFAGAGLTASLVAIVLILAKVIKHLMDKAKPPEPPIKDNCGLTAQQAEELHEIYKYQTEQRMQWEYLRKDIKSIQDEQDAAGSRITQLISSQQRVVDRIGDLIANIDKLLQRG